MNESKQAKDLLDVSRCPVGVRCESCGTEDGPLAPRPCRTDVGVLCLTVCPRCAGALGRMSPPIAVATAARLVQQHLRHLSGVSGGW